MGVIITPKEKIDEYFDSSAISQSRLKTLLDGLDSFLKDQQKSEKELYYSEKPHFFKGSGVDMQLTGNDGDFENEFYISKLETKPSDVEMSMIQWVFDALKDEVSIDEIGKLGNYLGKIQEAAEVHQWYKGKPGENRIAGFVQRGSLYFDELKDSTGKQILTTEENNTINNTVMSFRTHNRTKDYFDREAQIRAEHVDVYYQLPIYFEYRGKSCKALLDMLIVYKDDQNRITSIIPIDVKTMTGATLNFPFQLKRLRYDIQSAWYTLALESWLETQQTIDNPVIMNFKFLVESVSQPGNPLIYNLDNSLLSIGRYGRPELIVHASSNTDDFDAVELYNMNYTAIKGFEELFDLYTYYTDNDIKEDIRITEAEGIFKLDWNGIM